MQRQLLFWTIAAACVVLLLFVLRGVILPFVAGMALAYLLDPLADRLERFGIGRVAATFLIVGICLLVFIISLMVILPALGNQLAAFVDKMPATITRLQQLAAQYGGPILRRFGGETALPDLEKSIAQYAGQVATWFGSFLQSVWTSGQAVVSVLSLMVVTPIVAFYMLIDWDRMLASIDDCIPVKHKATVRALAHDVDRAIAGFLRGQAMVCVALGTFYAVGLSIVGLNFGVLIGIGSGLLTFIPYFGSFAGFVVSIGVAIVQFWPDWTMIVAVAAVYLVGQFLEGNILSPKLVGDAVGLHPVWLMFALFAFGSLFGFVGLLLAVPLAAAAGVLIRFAVHQYLASPLYDDGAKAVKTGPRQDGHV